MMAAYAYIINNMQIIWQTMLNHKMQVEYEVDFAMG
jgi:hypothetical protein